MRGRLLGLRSAIQTQLWPVPTLAVVTALVLGWALPRLDAAVDADLDGPAARWLFGGDADAARSLLGAISSSLITATSLTFSLTVVTLQLASSQFSPRLLRTFARDQVVQATLGLFLATFTYALTLLRAVRNAAEDQVEVVPRIAVTVAFLLAVASVLGLVLFLAHLARHIRVETMLANVGREGTDTVRLGLAARREGPRTPTPEPPAGAQPIRAPGDGFVTRFDHDALLESAVDQGASMRLEVYPGAFVVRGTRMGVCWSESSVEDTDQDLAARLGERISGAVHLGPERTSGQDVGFPLRQLTDVAIKALSPGVNDPTTAVHALGRISALLCALAERELGPEVLRDDAGRVRVVLERPDLATYVEWGIGQPRRYGASDPDVLQRIHELLLELAQCVPSNERSVVLEQLRRLRDTADAQDFDDVERDRLRSIGNRVEAALATSNAGRPSPPPDDQ